MSAMTYQSPLTAPHSGSRAPRPQRLPRAAVAARAQDTRWIEPRPAVLVRPADDRPARPATTTASPARLTRRGRVVVVLVLAVIAMVAFSLGRASSAATSAGDSGTARPRPTTVVQPGDTLWSISRRIAPGSDPRVMVERLSDLNDLGGRAIQAGQRLTLPYAGS